MRNMPPAGPVGPDDPTWPGAVTQPVSPQPQPQAVPQRAWPQRQQAAPAVQPGPPVYTQPVYMQPARGGPTSVSASYAVSRTLHSVAQLISIALGVVEIVLLIRIVLLFLDANPSAEFTSLIYGWSGPLVAPFQGVFPNVSGIGGVVIDTSAILAMIVYAIGARVAEGVLRMLARI